MIEVPIKKIQERWSELPEVLQDAIYSYKNDELLDVIAQENKLTADQRFDIGLLFQYVLYGFVQQKELFQEIKNALAIESSIALSVYHAITGRLLEGINKEIESNYKRWLTRQPSDLEKLTIAQEVNLKGAQSVNLKKEDAFAVAQRADAPVVINAIQPKTIPVHGGELSARNEQKEYSQQDKTSWRAREPGNPKDAPQRESMQIPDGPMIIHQKDEVQSTTQSRPQGGYKQMSYGSYKGSLRVPFAPKPSANPFFKAQIQVAHTQNTTQPEEKIPLTVKEFGTQKKEEEKATVVNYTEQKSIQSQEPNSKESINLNDFTINKK